MVTQGRALQLSCPILTYQVPGIQMRETCEFPARGGVMDTVSWGVEVGVLCVGEGWPMGGSEDPAALELRPRPPLGGTCRPSESVEL